MRATILLSVLVAGAFSPALHAQALDFSIAVGGWHYDPKGFVSYQGEDIDLDERLAVEEETAPRGWLTVEHPISLIPNLRLNYNRSNLSGRNALTAPITFGGTVFPEGATVSTDGSVDQYDATFYYGLADTRLSFDLGLGIRYLDGNVALSSPSQRESRAFSAYLPALYAKALFNLPVSGFSAGIEGSSVQYERNRMLDYEAKLAYELSSGFGLQGGWRHQQLRLDDVDEISTDIKLKGPFLDLYYHF